jgi:uncharacterized protein
MTDTTLPARPGPVIDRDSRPFWEGLARGDIVVQHCASCSAYRCPPLSACHVCGSTRFDWETIDGVGSVYSWIRVQHPVGSLVADELPVVFATVDFAHGIRLVARVLEADGIAIGMRVQADFAAHDSWTELVARIAGGAQ